MLILDFPWYLKQARDARTRSKLKEYEGIAEKLDPKHWMEFREEQEFPLRLGSFRFWLNDNSVFGSLDAYLELFKERHHTRLRDFLGTKDKVIVDLGASEGYYTLKMRENSPRARVVAAEPNPEAFRILRKNVKENNLKNVVLSRAVISDRIGEVDFEIVQGMTQIGALKIVEDREWLKRNGIRIRKIAARSTTLERLLKSNGIGKVDLLKIDVEGNEMKILESSRRILKDIRKIVVEYHGEETRKQVKGLLKENGFRLLFEESVESRIVEEVFPSPCGDAYFENRSFA